MSAIIIGAKGWNFMSRVMKAGTGFVIGAILLAANSSAQADGNCRSCPKGDLESLKARLDWAGNEWHLSIRYEVELKHLHPQDAVDLILTPLECGRELADRSGEAVRLTICVASWTVRLSPSQKTVAAWSSIALWLWRGVR